MDKIDTKIITAFRDKCKLCGARALLDEEIIALIIKTGDNVKDVLTLSKNLLRRYGSIRGICDCPLSQLVRENVGITEKKAMDIKIAFEFGYRSNKKMVFGEHIEDAFDVAEILRLDMKNRKQECFKAILLNTKNNIISIENISVGTINASLVHCREVFRTAISKNAQSIIVAHNHPSTDPTPSFEDIKITHRLVRAGDLIGIRILDHVIIGGDDYYSFIENGKLLPVTNPPKKKGVCEENRPMDKSDSLG